MEREDGVVGELEKLSNLSKLNLLKLSQIIMNDLNESQTFVQFGWRSWGWMGETTSSNPAIEFPCCIVVGLLSLGWIDRNFRLDILFHRFPMNLLLFYWINLGGYIGCGFY